MKAVISAAVTAVSFGVAGAAHAVTVDFSENNGAALSAGDILTDFDFGSGLTGTASVSNTGGGPDLALIFDSMSPTGGDDDLESPFTNVDDPFDMMSFGNVLIISEDGDVNDPDDEAGGGSITFTFDNAINLSSIALLDGEEDISVSTSAGFNQSGFGGPDNTFDIAEINQSGIVSFTVTFGGSGAIGAFDAQLAPVPLPATLPMLAFGLAGAGYVMRRQQRKS